MRLATIRLGGSTAAARLDGDTLTVLPFADVAALLASGPDWQQTAAQGTGPTVDYGDADLAAVVPHPEKVLCIGLNYRSHALEANLELPDHPVLFAKYWRSLIGPNDPIEIPHNSDEVDWEAELGLVIGRPTRYVDEEHALDSVAGYTIINDVSMRDWQRRTSQYLQGKTFEASTPVGPLLVTPDEIDHGRSLRITCAVDGEVMQDANTNDLVFSCAQIVSYLSQIITLSPGDLIATGTPAGVGGGRTPAIFLLPGQTMTTSIEGLGEQRNLCVESAEVAV